jgi:malate dehydrogenase (quinone)
MSVQREYDAFLIGAGIMSATLGTLFKELRPHWKIGIVEQLSKEAQESSNAYNNAGTGHSGFCELNYDVDKAVRVCEAFEKSKQFWSYLVKEGKISPDFIHNVPHISFVEGQVNVDELRKRYKEFKKYCLFSDMEFTDDRMVLKEWMPLIVNGRNRAVPIAATRMKRGTDINFGALTSELIKNLENCGVHTEFNEKVVDIKRNVTRWDVVLENTITKVRQTVTTRFLFVGAGGAALSLLQKADIPEIKGYGGFPVSGQFLICDNPKVVARHNAKVYGKPSIGAPPMSVPHMDTRIIDGKKVLLFGPYAGFSTKFLKSGSWLDFFRSLRFSNIGVILMAGLRNLGLSKYLFKEVIKDHKARFKVLQAYYPAAHFEDWKPIIAGQRVQVIKKDKGIPTIEFGTEIVTSAGGTIAGLLGASPGASTSVKIMIDLIEKCFREQNLSAPWTWGIGKIIPSHETPLHKDHKFFEEIEEESCQALKLH